MTASVFSQGEGFNPSVRRRILVYGGCRAGACSRPTAFRYIDNVCEANLRLVFLYINIANDLRDRRVKPPPYSRLTECLSSLVVGTTVVRGRAMLVPVCTAG